MKEFDTPKVAQTLDGLEESQSASDKCSTSFWGLLLEEDALWPQKVIRVFRISNYAVPFYEIAAGCLRDTKRRTVQ